MKRILFSTVLATAGSAATAGTDFGTRAEAEQLADALVAIIQADGLATAAEAVTDPDGPFRDSPMGVNLFHGSVVIADNREPESVAADFAETADLTGELAWPRIRAAADKDTDVVLKWYHYDTQEAYDFHCYSTHAEGADAVVMVCR